MAVPAQGEPIRRARAAQAAELGQRFAAGERELFVPLAELARREGRAEEAQRLLEAGLASWPRRVSAWIALARLEAQRGRMDEALGHYRRVLSELDARNLPALRALAAAALAAGESAAAQRYLAGWAAEDAEDPELDELREVLAALPAIPAAATAAGAGAPGLPEFGLAEAAAGYLSAPSPADAAAWPAARPAGRERG